MITVPMSATDIRCTRFAFSPLAEVAESLHMIASGSVAVLHRRWFAAVRDGLRRLDMPLLRAVVPARPFIADFLFTGATDSSTTIEDQMQLVAEMPTSELRRELEGVWRNEPIPDAALKVLNDATGGPRRLADALWQYWSTAMDPHWPSMRAVLEEDVAFRASELTKGGLGAMLAELHPTVRLVGDVLHIDKRVSHQEDLAGAGLVLVPSVFVWPNAIFATSAPGRPCSLTYAARGVGNVWTQGQRSTSCDDPLGALLGRSRAAILDCLALPMSTTELALKLGQSPPSISQHLAVLRRSGLATSWRSGRRVLYHRTPLADSIIDANTPGGRPPGERGTPRSDQSARFA